MRLIWRYTVFVTSILLIALCAAAPTEHYSEPQRRIREPIAEPETTEYYIPEPTQTLSLEPTGLEPRNDTVIFAIRQNASIFNENEFRSGLAQALSVPESDIQIGEVEDAGDGHTNVAVTLAPEAWSALRDTNPAELSGIGVEQYSFVETVVNYCLDNPCASNQTCVSGPEGAECHMGSVLPSSTAIESATEAGTTTATTAEATATGTEVSSTESTFTEPAATGSSATETAATTEVTGTETSATEPVGTETQAPETTTPTETAATEPSASETATSSAGPESATEAPPAEATVTVTAETTVTVTATTTIATESPADVTGTESSLGTETTGASQTTGLASATQTEIPIVEQTTAVETSSQPATGETASDTATGTGTISGTTTGAESTTETPTPTESSTTESTTAVPTATEGPVQAPGEPIAETASTSAPVATEPTVTETPAATTTETTETGPVIIPTPPILLPPSTPTPGTVCSSFTDCDSCTNANCKYQPTNPPQCTDFCLIADLACYSKNPDGTNNCAAATSIPVLGPTTSTPTSTSTEVQSTLPPVSPVETPTPASRCKGFQGCDECTANSCLWQVQLGCFDITECNPETDLPCYNGTSTCPTSASPASLTPPTNGTSCTTDADCSADTPELCSNGVCTPLLGRELPVTPAQAPPTCLALAASSELLDITSCGPASVNSACEVRCAPGYEGSPAQLVCTQTADTAQWTGSLPDCKAPPACSALPPSSLVDGSACGSAPLGSSCEVKCAAGYQGGSARFVCSRAGDSAQWVGAMPECRAPTCGSLAAPSNSVNTRSCGNSALGGSCQVQCADGYQGQSAQFVCSRAGDTAQWVGNMPDCKEVPSCAPLAAPSELFDTSSCQSANAQSTCEVTCSAGYTAPASQFVCTQSGDTAQWTGRMPDCKVLLCGTLAPPGTHTDTSMCTFGVVGDKCPVRCSYGYLGDPALYVCSDVGGSAQWVGTAPTCQG